MSNALGSGDGIREKIRLGYYTLPPFSHKHTPLYEYKLYLQKNQAFYFVLICINLFQLSEIYLF
jgi:hypothetical protein